MYRIGEFAKIVDIPVRTLRYYDEYGVLSPSVIDDFTGYRYYDEKNVVECELIKLLKSLDFTLEEIILYKNCLDEEVIKKKKKELEERMYLLRLKYQRLSIMEEEIKNNKNKYNQVPKESEEEKVLRRKYEKRNVGKGA